MLDIGELAKFGDDYFVLGVRFYSGENHANRDVRPPHVTVLAIKKDDRPGEWSSVPPGITIYERSVEFKTYEEFFHYFKRFSVVVLRKGFPGDTEYETEDLDGEEE